MINKNKCYNSSPVSKSFGKIESYIKSFGSDISNSTIFQELTNYGSIL